LGLVAKLVNQGQTFGGEVLHERPAIEEISHENLLDFKEVSASNLTCAGSETFDDLINVYDQISL
jgi:hypothetical protein